MPRSRTEQLHVVFAHPMFRAEDVRPVADVDPRVRVHVMPEGSLPGDIDHALNVLPPPDVLVAWGIPSARAHSTIRWIQLLGSGTDGVSALDEARARGVLVTTGAGTNAPSMAQYCVGMILHWANQFTRIERFRSERRWQIREAWCGTAVLDRTVGIVGFGAVARSLAPAARALGMQILALKHPPRRPERQRFSLGGPQAEPDEWIPLEELLRRSDYVVSTVPLTTATAGLFNDDAFALMRPESVLINVSRGGVVDEQALFAALRNSQIRGCSLDVYSDEPVPSDSEFFQYPNIIMTPHVSGLHQNMTEYAVRLVKENTVRFLSGETMLNLVE